MSVLENINHKLYTLHSILSESDSYPYSLSSGTHIHGIAISNNSNSDAMTVIITQRRDGKEIQIPVRASQNFESRVKELQQLAVVTDSSSYNIALYERG